MANRVNQTIVQRKNDPFIYLLVEREWYCYNPEEHYIGGGAMGDVFRGYRCNTGEYVAIKRVKVQYENNKMIRERARQEASLAFRHPNLVEMIGCCEYAPDHGPIFILSNYVQGNNVDEYVKSFGNTPSRTEKVCKIVCSVLDALDYIHSRGVIHRDIKPSNIMVEAESNIRLMDLGISRVSGGNKFSLHGFIGTPEYSAPEQIKRDLEMSSNSGLGSINPTTDIYELGITFYELLTGNNPMDCETDVETLTKQVTAPLPNHPAIPRKLMQVILKATEKQQAKRYQSALEFKNAINAALMPDPPLLQRISARIEDNIILVASIIVFIIVLAFIIVLIL